MSEDKLMQRATDALDYVNELEIKDQASLDLGNKCLKRIGEVKKAINDFFVPLVLKAHQAHKALCDKKKEVEGPILQADGVIKQKIRAYVMEQERIKQEALEKARQAEEEKKRMEEEALEKAVALQDEGKTDEALDVLDKTAEKVDKIKAEVPTGPVMKGSHTTTFWTWELENIEDVLRIHLTLNTAMINVLVRNGERNIPGIRIFQDTRISRSRG